MGAADGTGYAVVGLELVAGYLVAWSLRKARRVGAGLDDEVDVVIDAGLDRVHELVAGELGPDPALTKLEADAVTAEAVSDRTRRRVEDAVEEAAESDPRFASQLAEALAAVQEALANRPPDGREHPAVTMTAKVSGHGRAFQAGRDMHINGQ